MKEILKVVRFDYLTVKPLTIKVIIFCLLMFGSLGLVISPIILSYITIIATFMLVPLHSIEDKSNFHMFYGIIPVNRKSIVRARFLYIFLIYMFFEVFEYIIFFVSKNLKLYRFIPNQESEVMKFLTEGFSDVTIDLSIILFMFILFCLIFSYMEMMGQIYGRESEFKIIMITIAVIGIIAFLFGVLNNRDIIPVIKLPSLPGSTGGMIIFVAVMNILMFGVCALFGEITAKKISGREL